MPKINAFLKLGRDQNCSDIHLAVGMPPMLRLMGDLIPVKYRDISHDEMEELIYETLNKDLRKQLKQNNDLDFSYDDPDVGRFRVNVFRKLTGLGATFRAISSEIPTLEKLGMPPVLETMLYANHGLILVTGATGTGKTSTLAAMISILNNNRRMNIITLEDPIEFIHKCKMSLVIQREVGVHVDSFADGLRAALREDPDVILVGELRDPDTIALAMTAAETGHLVLGTLHTSSASKTLDRIIDAMPTEQKTQTAIFLAQNLRGVVSQKLVRSADGKSRKAIVEVMVNTPAIANLLLNGKVHQIDSTIMTSSDKGMQLFDQALLASLQAKEVDPDEAYLAAIDKKVFQQYVTDPELLPQIDLNVS